ncbi:DUF2628 domain-containing protein [Hoeflea sp. YIM 152468]|uniref:DUF2628 domain-containing protein n=1 Tax=Hoeflea sp. YIM 152468 TaxID=3031759 RepID=UPI0023D9AA04|nr:DUF2628 domain-containing protein [Hoeflea sp. YIM 152468]MDF1610483.1 DUF2628 domain-containing protein [Hoeflea sp. YIM 152468]
MTTYLVLASPGARIPDQHSVMIADRFAPLAFVAPVLWLLFSRLWLEAIGALLLLSAAVMAGSSGQPFAGLAISLAVSTITALEGRNWRSAALQRRGWRLVDVVEADDPETAYEIHASQAVEQAGQTSARAGPPVLKPGRPTGRETGSIGLVPVERI